LPTSNKVLDELVAVLNEFPDVRLEVQGHTDDQIVRPGGRFKDNEELSQARADAVRSYIVVVMGIAAERLVAKGYGATKPVVDPAGLAGARLAAARAKNRRVELQIIVP